jgi:hypothetical protein
MSRKHHSEPKDHPTHPVKAPNEVNQSQAGGTNGPMSDGHLSQDEKLVEVGRGMQTSGRQTEPRG